MNIQAMMKQAQKLQNDMMTEKNKIDNKEFVGKSSFVTVTLKGTKKVESIKIEQEELDKDDLEMLEDLILTCVNEALRKVDSATNQAMGQFNIPGLM